MPGLVKIGHAVSVQDRVQTMCSTHIPGPFHVAYQRYCESPISIEQAIHSSLAKFRVYNNREFFQIPIGIAIEISNKIIDGTCVDISSYLFMNIADGASSVKEIAKIMRLKRESAHLTQFDLAELCGIGRNSIIRLEHGDPGLTVGRLLTVLKVLQAYKS